jgi:hypothetical protein
MDRKTALERMEAGFRQWTTVDLSDALFVKETDLLFEGDSITCRREALAPLGADDDWRGMLEPTKAWINASLLTSGTGEIVVSLLVGPPVTLSAGEEPSVNVSLERRPLRIE